ncbi:MAG: aminotransferase class IV [Epsilonproteobacteria bacterium]|nr:aminotransferase class IV [Campylobacterota bacterium]
MSEKFLETIKIKDGSAHHLAYHQKRVDAAIGRGVLDLAAIIEPPKDQLYRCRIVYDAKDYEVQYLPYQKRQIKTLKLVFDDTLEYEKKYANREAIDHLFVQREGCDDILIVQEGYITDTSIANVAFYDGDHWLTPNKPLLRGTTRQRLLDEGKIIAKDIHYKEIKNFQKIALMNAMIDFAIIAQDNIEEVIC